MNEEKLSVLALDAIMADARGEAASASTQLAEVAELLATGKYVRAIGAFDGIEERVHYIRVVLHRFARHLGLRP